MFWLCVSFFSQNVKQIHGEDVPYLVLGDSAYPLQRWLMKGYPHSSSITPEQDSFNVRLNKARVVVEIAFGKLKARWRCLHRKIELDVHFVPMIVTASCTLHNIVQCLDQSFKDSWLEEMRQNSEFIQPEADEIPGDALHPSSQAERIQRSLEMHSRQLPQLRSCRMRFEQA